MPPNPFTLTGRSALITGGTSGIGLAIARRFLELDAQSITIVSRSEHNLERAKADLQSRKLSPEQGIGTLLGDISKPDFWFQGHTRLVLDGTDTLINSAGIAQQSLLTYTHDDEIRSILDTNLLGTISTSKAFLKAHLKSHFRLQRELERERKHNESPPDPGEAAAPSPLPLPTGCIINIASLLANKRGAGSAVYAASKAGVLGFTRALAHEMSMRDRGRMCAVRVNAIVPGYVDTPMLKDLTSRSKLLESIPMGRLGTPEEIADAAVFLACSTYAHNCVLNLDGGLSAT